MFFETPPTFFLAIETTFLAIGEILESIKMFYFWKVEFIPFFRCFWLQKLSFDKIKQSLKIKYHQCSFFYENHFLTLKIGSVLRYKKSSSGKKIIVKP